MKNRFLKPVGGLASVLVLAFCAMQVPGRAQVQPATLSTNLVNSKLSAGTTAMLNVSGYSNCTVYAFDSNASGTITVYGSSAQNPQIGDGTFFANGNFNTTGSVTLTTTPATTTGNIANQPTGFYVGWTGETGTITLFATCTTAQASSVSSGSSSTNATIVSPLCGGAVCVALSPSPAPWPTTSPGGVPLLTYTKPNEVFHLTTTSTTGCQNLFVGSGALYDLVNVDTAQVVAISLYDEGTSPSCAAADRVYAPLLGTSQITFFGPFGHGLTNGLSYNVSTGSITGAGVWIDASKQQL